VSEEKDEQKKNGKKKEITCFRCKKVGHYASKCNEELPAKTPKSGTNMLIADEDSWNGNSDGDDNDDDGQYEQTEYDEEVEDAPPEAIQQSTQDQDHANAETECDDVTTEDESEQGEYYEGQFDDADFEGVMFVQSHVVCNVQEKAGIPNTWILLDSQSTVDVFCNARLLSNVRDAKRQLVLHCNAGTTIVTKKGDLKGYGTVWLHPEGIANILSLSNVSKKYRVTYDSGDKEEQGLVVHKEDGSKRVFSPSRKGLYYSDVVHDVGTVMVHTVDSNKSKYSVRQYVSESVTVQILKA